MEKLVSSLTDYVELLTLGALLLLITAISFRLWLSMSPTRPLESRG